MARAPLAEEAPIELTYGNRQLCKWLSRATYPESLNQLVFAATCISHWRRVASAEELQQFPYSELLDWVTEFDDAALMDSLNPETLRAVPDCPALRTLQCAHVNLYTALEKDPVEFTRAMVGYEQNITECIKLVRYAIEQGFPQPNECASVDDEQ